MANTNILNNVPFGDPNLKSTVTTLQKETPEVTYYPTGTITADPGNVEVTLLSYEIEGHPIDRPFELRIEALVGITNALSVAADQEFLFELHDTDLDAVLIQAAPIDVDVLETGEVKVKLDFVYRSADLANVSGWWTYSTATDNAAATGAEAFIAVEEPIVSHNLALVVIPETGTASTDIVLYSAKVTLDRQVWN